MADNQEITVIGADTYIKGEMTFDSTARVLGTFEGTITAKGEIQIAHGATCRATIEARIVSVDGKVEGNVTAHEKLILSAKAQMTGDLIAPTLVVAEGATFTGHVQVGPDAGKNGRAATKSASSTEPKVSIPSSERAAVKK